MADLLARTEIGLRPSVRIAGRFTRRYQKISDSACVLDRLRLITISSANPCFTGATRIEGVPFIFTRGIRTMNPNPPGDGLHLIQQQIERLSQECAELTSAYARARGVRRILALAIVIFIIVVCFAFYRLCRGLLREEYTQKLTSLAEKRLEKNQDRYMAQIEKLVNKTSPAVSEAFSQQVNKDMPVYLKLMERERDVMAKDLETKLGGRLQKRYESSLDRHDKILKTEFPQVKDEVLHQRVTNNLHVVVNRLVEKYYVTELERQLKELFATWDRFPAAAPAGKNDQALEDELVAELVHLLAIKLGSTQVVPRQ